MTPGIISSIIDFFFPRLCIVCRRQAPVHNRGSLCSFCLNELQAVKIRGRRCLQCGITLTSEEALCLSCRDLDNPGPAGRGLFYYRGAASVLLQRYKFEGVKSLSRIIADEIFRELTEAERDYVIVPIPSGKKSRRRNGWGHMEQVANCLKERGLEVCSELLKRSAGKEQKSLDRQAREENSRTVFRHSGKKSEKSCLLIDDVRTTGASIRAASAALEAGGTRVKGWIVFAID